MAETNVLWFYIEVYKIVNMHFCKCLLQTGSPIIDFYNILSPFHSKHNAIIVQYEMESKIILYFDRYFELRTYFKDRILFDCLSDNI
jgi:hypothetical protein